jgi:hypothetical protein
VEEQLERRPVVESAVGKFEQKNSSGQLTQMPVIRAIAVD